MANEPIKVLTEEGLRVLWNQISLDDYPNNDLLIAALDAIDTTKADKDEVIAAKEEVLTRIEVIESAGADWNQNNESAIDYIKNRTHWVDNESRTVIMEEQTVFSNWESDSYSTHTLSTPLELNQTCIITLDGVEYEGVFGRHHENKLPYIAVTNGDFIFDSVGVDSIGSSFQFVYLTTDNFTGVAKIEIEGGISYHPLNEQFIPDTIARVSYVNDNLATKADKTALDNYYTKSEETIFYAEIKDSIDATLQTATDYTDQVKSDIYGGIPAATLDTLTELATAYEQHDEVIEILDAAITTKADKADLEVVQKQVLADSLIIVDAITGDKYKLQIHEGQLVSFPIEKT